MCISEAKKLVGKVCCIQWVDRNGQQMSTVSKIHDAMFVPLYGGYLITDTEDVRLDRIKAISVLAADGSAVSVFSETNEDMQQAA